MRLPLAPLLLAAALLLAGCVGLGGDEAEGPAPSARNASPPRDPASNATQPSDPTPGGGNETSNEKDPPRNDTGGFSDTHVFPGAYEELRTWHSNYSRVVEPGPHDKLAYEAHTLESDVDGAKLRVGLHRPDVPNGTDVPVVVLASPYFDTIFRGNATDAETDHPTSEDFRTHYYGRALVENLVPHGHAVALVPVRGTAGNGGCTDVLGPKEKADLDQVTTWLGTRGWSNGNVGFFGLSYDGGTAWMAAATGNPHVETIVPLAGVNSLYDLSFPNGTATGISFAWGPAYLASGNGIFNSVPGTGRSAETAGENVVCPAAAEGLTAALESYATRTPDRLGWWEARDHRDEVEASYNGSVFLVQALDDQAVGAFNQYPWVNTLEDEGVTVKHWLGRWGHNYPDEKDDVAAHEMRWDFQENLLRWFDHWLKENVTRDLGPPVQVADTEGRWRSADAWPPEDAAPRPFHMTPGGDLASNATEGTDQVVVGPDPARTLPNGSTPGPPPHETPGSEAACGGCAAFRSPPMEETMRWAGRPALDVTVTPTGPRGYVTAHLYRQGPGGGTHLLTAGQIALRFADGDGEPEEVAPGEPMAVNLTLDPQDAVVPEGHRLKLVVSQSSYREMATRAPHPTLGSTPVLLHVGGGQSMLTLETFDVAGDAFFTPPDVGG